MNASYLLFPVAPAVVLAIALATSASAGVTVKANGQSVVHKGSGGMSIAFPDVCKTPILGVPVPVPYPNIAKSKGSKGQKTVKVPTKDGDVKSDVVGVETQVNPTKVKQALANFASTFDYLAGAQPELPRTCRGKDAAKYWNQHLVWSGTVDATLVMLRQFQTAMGMKGAQARNGTVYLRTVQAANELAAKATKTVSISLSRGVEACTPRSSVKKQTVHQRGGTRPKLEGGGSADGPSPAPIHHETPKRRR